MQSETIGFTGSTVLGPAMLGIDTVISQQNRSNINQAQHNHFKLATTGEYCIVLLVQPVRICGMELQCDGNLTAIK